MDRLAAASSLLCWPAVDHQRGRALGGGDTRRGFSVVMAYRAGTYTRPWRSFAAPRSQIFPTAGTSADGATRERSAELDRRRVREQFEERFTAGRMAADYVSHYQSVVNGTPRLPTIRVPAVKRARLFLKSC